MPIKRQVQQLEHKLSKSEEEREREREESSTKVILLERELSGVQQTLKKMTRSFELREAAAGVAPGARLHKPKWNYRMLFEYAENSWMVTAALNKIIQAATKGSGPDGKGEPWEFVPKFNFKCSNCGAGYDQKPDRCETCESVEFREPDETQLQAIEALLDRPNPYHSWTRILRGIIRDQEIVDDWFLEVIPSKSGTGPAELWLLNAAGMEIASDDRGQLGNGEWFCPTCYGEQDPEKFKDKIYKDVGKGRKEDPGTECPKCGTELKETAYILRSTDNKIAGRWGEDEIIHGNKYGCPTLFGKPKLVSLIGVVGVLLWMEKYQYAAYSENVMPDSILAFPKLDTDEVQRMMLEVKEFKEKNPQSPKNLALGVPEAPQVLQTMKSLVDLEAKEMQLYYREAIAITYGVSLTSLGVQTPGKLGRETEVVEVSYETMEEVQGTVEEAINRFLLPKFRTPEDQDVEMITDWEFRLISPKKDDIQRRANIQQTVATAVNTLMGIEGLSVEITDDWDIKVSGKATGLRSTPMSTGPFKEETPTRKLEKTLSSRNIDREEAVSGIREAEEEFLKEVRKKYLARIEELGRAGKKLDEKALRKELKKLIDKLDEDLAKRVEKLLGNVYMAGLDKAKKEFPDAVFQQQDQAAIDLLKESPKGIIPRLKTFSDAQRDLFEGIIRRAYEEPGEFDLGKMVRDMRRAALDETYKLERIARSETTKISNTARMNQYKKYADPEDEYEWIVAHDHRLCEVCQAIANGGTVEIFGKSTEFHGNPYTLKELEQLIPNFLPHPNCRCTFVRRVRL